MSRICHVLLLALMLLLTATTVASPASAATTGGSGGALTDRLNQTFTSGGITSNYHVYAAGLDWTKPVGIVMYVDGSGGYGYDNPSSTYSLGGANGVVAKAKSDNLLLVVPNAPAPNCDGYDNCWYNESGTPTAAQKAGWSSALMTAIKGQYNIDLDRVAVGGYSSGAQWATRWFMPLYGEAQSVDLAVAISYGGAPYSTANFSAAYKAATWISFDTGTADPAYSSASYGAIGGYNWYTNAGFKTDANWVAGEDHSRDGLFGGILDREIDQHLPAGGGGTTTPPPTTNAWDTTVSPTRTGGTFSVAVPSGYSGRVYVRLSDGTYQYDSFTGPTTAQLTFASRPCGTPLSYTVEAPSGTPRKTGSFSTLPC